MDLKDILAIAWKRKLTIAIATIFAVAIAAVIAFTATKQYESTETLALSPNVKLASGQVGANSLSVVMPTYGLYAESASNKTAAATILGHPLTASVSSSTTAGTGILQIIAKSPVPADAQQTASAVSEAFVGYLGTKNPLVATVAAPAQLPTSPVSPRKSLILGGGLILGLAVGFALALALNHWFDRVSTATEVSAATGLTCLGLIPHKDALRAGGPRSLVWGDDPELFALQEAIRSLRTTLQLSLDAENRILQVTSPTPGDGKSTIAANLAVAIASVGIPTTLIDADFWAPRQHLIFGISNARGLSGIMKEGRETRPPLQRTAFRNLRVLTTGPLPNNPTELIAAGIESVLERVRKVGRIIVIDTPPVLAVSDSRLIAAQADSVLLVARAGQTKAPVLRSAVEQLQLAQSHVAGVVLNGVAKLPAEQAPYGSYYMRPRQPLVLADDRTSRADA